MENKKVIAYGYFSGLGISTRENAEEHFKDYISKNKKWSLKEIYLHTGSKQRNDEMIRKIENKIENKEVDIIVLLKLKHLGKEKDFYNFVDKALANDVDVVSIKDDFNTLDSYCKTKYYIMRTMFEERKKIIRDRNKKTLDR